MGRLNADLKPKVRDILQHADTYHATYYAEKTFGGPSLHFHRRALGLDGQVSEEDRLELIYAVLTSWGMHRMGAKGSKMQPFENFRESVEAVAPMIRELATIHPEDLGTEGWSALERVFKTVEVMATKTRVVGNSKVLAHLLPNLVTPVDREYTLKYLFNNTYVYNQIDGEWRLLRKILMEFFYPIVADAGFQAKAALWAQTPDAHRWDTSPLKVVDNLVIGAMKAKRVE